VGHQVPLGNRVAVPVSADSTIYFTLLIPSLFSLYKENKVSSWRGSLWDDLVVCASPEL
jgi:hypothetical protein